MKWNVFVFYRLALVILIAIPWFAPLTMAQTVTQAPEDKYEQQLRKLAKIISKLQKEMQRVKTNQDALQQQLQNSEREASELSRKIKSIEEALNREKKHLARHQSQRAELESSRRRQQAQINRIVRQAYQFGRQSQIKLLLNQEEPHRISRLLRYHNYIVSAHKVKRDTYLRTIADITKTEAIIVATTQRLDANRIKLDQRYQQLKKTQGQRTLTLNKVKAELRSKGASLSQLRANQERLERLLEEATQALSKLKLPGDAKPFSQTRGKLPIPARGRILHEYGSPRLQGKLRWNGLFIAGKSGAPVVSVHYGRVIFSDYLRGHGLLLIIDHGDDYMSLYAHNQTLLKETGDWVRSGETIATVGNTGGQTRDGLYFEIRYRGKPQSPRRWLAKR